MVRITEKGFLKAVKTTQSRDLWREQVWQMPRAVQGRGGGAASSLQKGSWCTKLWEERRKQRPRA